MFLVYAPIFNEMQYIERYLKSVFSINHLDYLFLIDGDSDDGTYEYLQEYQKKDDRLILFQSRWDYSDVAMVKKQRNLILNRIE